MADLEINLREFLEARINDLERRLDQYMESHRREQDSALTAMDRRLEGMNEFRDQMNDAQGKFLTRAEWEGSHKEITKRAEDLALAMQTKVGQAEMRSVYKVLYMAVGMAVLASFLIPLAVSMWRGK